MIGYETVSMKLLIFLVIIPQGVKNSAKYSKGV